MLVSLGWPSFDGILVTDRSRVRSTYCESNVFNSRKMLITAMELSLLISHRFCRPIYKNLQICFILCVKLDTFFDFIIICNIDKLVIKMLYSFF